MHGVLFALTLLTCLGCALAAGAFFAFSTFVMRGLAQLPPAQGIAAMQAINVAVEPWFVGELVGTAAASIALIVWSITGWDQAYAGYLLIGGVLYLAGAIGLTGAYHIPRNNALEEIEPGGAGAARHWHGYVTAWTRANHLRTVACLGATALFAIALTTG